MGSNTRIQLRGDIDSVASVVVGQKVVSLLVSVIQLQKGMKCASVVRFHHMLAYQIELGYDLSLAPDKNVSGNPGFEAVLGVICTIE